MNNTALDLEGSTAKSLFLGEILEQNLFPFPKIEAAEAENLRMVLDAIDKFFEGRQEELKKFDKEGESSKEYLNGLKEMGLFGIIIPEEYGGVGLSVSSYARIIQQTSRYDASTSLTIGAHTSIGMRGLLLFGSPDQKQRYLSRLATGEMLAAFCLTEHCSGSDAASIQTRAEKQKDGSWILNGSKIWITNGGIADFFTVFARTDSEKGRLSAFIVERAWEGVSSGPEEDKLGIRASNTCSVHFSNVKLPAEALLGEEGKGFKVAVSILNSGRTGLGGGCIGGMKRSIALASNFAKERKQFGKSISEFGLVKEKIAQMTINCFASESLISMVGHYIDSKVSDFSIEAAMSKIYSSECMWHAANEALQVAGGSGYMMELPFQQTLRDSRINMIFEGTNEILRLYIGLSGIRVAGEYLQGVQKGFVGFLNDPIKGFGVLSGYASRKVSRFSPIGRDKIKNETPELSPEAAVYEQYAAKLAHSTEGVVRRYGKDIVGRQFETKRLADAATDLFVGLCILSRVSQMIRASSAEKCQFEIGIARTFTQQARRRMSQSLRRIDKNEDEFLKNLSDFIVERGEYPWDTV